jgi:hypothetical protein
MILNQTITNFSLKTKPLNSTELLIMNRTELFQFGFKTVGYGSVYFFVLIQFSLTVRFDFLVFLSTPKNDHDTLFITRNKKEDMINGC